MAMNLHALRLFEAVARAGSITRAADALGISQPAITAQLKRFEAELSVTLYRAHSKGIQLSDAGELLLPHARHLFALERGIEQVLDALKTGTHGTVRLSATYLPGNFLIPGWVAAYKKQHPEVDFTITITNAQGAFDQVLNAGADLAVYGGQLLDHVQLHVEELFRDELWFVVPRDHPLGNQSVSLAEIVQEPFIMREEGSATRARLLSLCAAHGVPTPRIGLQFNSLHETVSAVMAGYGTNFVSSMVVRGHVARGELARVRVEDVQLWNTIALYTRKDALANPAAQQFTQTIRTVPTGG